MPSHNAAAEAAAEVALDTVMARVGVDGLLAAARNPGLDAAVDQHATAVRRAVAATGSALTLGSLARYATSVSAAAVRMGRDLPAPQDVDWSRASWFQLRLTGVCRLALDLR
jgi:hypothetical protein